MSSTAAGRYSQLESGRRPFLDRARDAAKLTIPTLVPPDGSGAHTKYYTPFQSVGAEGVNSLANKLLTTLLPPNAPFFKLTIDDFALEELTQRPDARAEVEKTLNKIERGVQTEVSTTRLAVPAFEAIKQLIVAGNVLCYLPKDKGMKVFRLDRHVVHRDPMGNVLEMITKESIAETALPPELLQAIPKDKTVGDSDKSPERVFDLFTHVKRANKVWTIYQEVKGIKVPGSRGTYPLDRCPWIPLRWTQIDGEDYGRGRVEEYYGDLRSLEALSKAIVHGAAAAAKVLFLVNPNGTTKVDVLAKGESGDFKSGNAQDVTVLQLDKYADFRVALELIDTLNQRLSRAFLMTSSVQRNAERVTAEEIRLMATELEGGLGGVYGLLSQEFQYPLVECLLARMTKQGRLPPLPKDLIRPTITTGMDALGRGNDLSKLDALIQGLGQLFGPEVLAQYVNVPDYISRRGTALGIDMGGLVKSPEQMAAEQQQAQMQQLIQQLGPNAMNILRDQMDPSKNGAQAQSQPAAAA